MYKAEGDNAHAIEELRRAADAFPYYGGEGNPYKQLAEIHESRGEKREAIAALESLMKFNETDNEALKKLARLRTEIGDRKGSLEALATSFYIYPFDPDLHKLSGAVYLEEVGQPKPCVNSRWLCRSIPPTQQERITTWQGRSKHQAIAQKQSERYFGRWSWRRDSRRRRSCC